MGGKIQLMSSKKKGSHLLKGHSKFIFFIYYFLGLADCEYINVTVVSLDCRFGGRLASIKENNKFRGTAEDGQSEPSGLKDFVLDIKKNFGLK